jgi:hypothetical protein
MFAANRVPAPLAGGADLAVTRFVPAAVRRHVARSACAFWMVILSASPFTAPFRTCDLSLLLTDAPVPFRGTLPAPPGHEALTHAWLPPSAMAATTVRVRFPALGLAGERTFAPPPRMTRSAPSFLPSDPGVPSPRLFVLRI